MYCRNILDTFKSMTDDEELIIHFRSGKDMIVTSNSVMGVVNADLQIIRRDYNDKRVVTFIDPAEVERIRLAQKDKI